MKASRVEKGRKRWQHSWLLLLVGSASCVSTGDRNVEGQTASKGSLCAQYCRAAEDSDCDVESSCEEDCQDAIRAQPECVDLADALYTCAVEREVPCDSRGEPAIPRACSRDEATLLACLGEDEEGAGATPSATQADGCDEALDCAECCLDTHEGLFTLFDTGFACKCQESECLNDCFDWCTDPRVLTRDDVCDACWQSAEACDDMAVAACNDDDDCLAGVECAGSCP